MNKKWFYLIGLLLAITYGIYTYTKYRVAPGLDLENLLVTNLMGQPVKISDYKGKKIVICFSASWCGNCIEELDDLYSIKESQLKEVEVLVISEEPIEKIRRFKDRKEYPFTFLRLMQPFASLGINSIPTSYLINTKLEIKQETVGYLHWRDASTAQYLLKLMQ